ncbi:MAG: redoxin domain-containing protein, partial [Chloroflexi bacterium]|nr:redoxin domain-containing protein [Chloroflexota bacterium]
DLATLPDNVARGELAPDFTVITLTGESFTLSDYHGSWVLLTFMANGCPSCVYEITSLAEVYPAYAGQGLVTLVVDIQPFDTPVSLQRYIDSFPYPMVNWTIDSEARVAPLYNVLELGTTLLINPNGNIVYRDRQATGPEEFQQLLELAVSAAP